MAKTWNECSLAEQQQRRVNFGEVRNRNAERDSYNAELVRRYFAGEPLTRDDKRRAAKLVKQESTK